MASPNVVLGCAIGARHLEKLFVEFVGYVLFRFSRRIAPHRDRSPQKTDPDRLKQAFCSQTLLGGPAQARWLTIATKIIYYAKVHPTCPKPGKGVHDLLKRA